MIARRISEYASALAASLIVPSPPQATTRSTPASRARAREQREHRRARVVTRTSASASWRANGLGRQRRAARHRSPARPGPAIGLMMTSAHQRVSGFRARGAMPAAGSRPAQRAWPAGRRAVDVDQAHRALLELDVARARRAVAPPARRGPARARPARGAGAASRGVLIASTIACGRAAGSQRLDLGDGPAWLQPGAEHLRRLPRAGQRAGEHEVDHDVHRDEPGDRLLESLDAVGRQRPQAIVGILRTALRGDGVTNEIQLDGGGHGLHLNVGRAGCGRPSMIASHSFSSAARSRM